MDGTNNMMTRQTWIVLGIAALALVAACGPRQSDRSENKSQPSSSLSSGQTIAVEWSLAEISDPDGVNQPKTRVSITVTDQTGSARVEPMGEFLGRCGEVAGPGARGDAVLALSCRHQNGGIELRVRRYGAALVLLRAPTGPGYGELSFEEAGRIEIPPGATVRATQ